MAKPQQRRKARSGKSNKPSPAAKREIKKRLARAATVKGPDVLKDQWDGKLTVRQNYAKLGLLPDLSLRDSGGAEVPRTSTLPAAPTGPKGVRKGMGRIVRDADGNVTIVEDEEEEAKANSATPWGRPMEPLGPVEEQLDAEEEGEERSTSEEVDDIAGSQAEENSVVQSLSALAATARPVPRHQSQAERSWLQRLVERYADDYEAMARDKVDNPWQKTAGEIRRAVKKAGGTDAVLSS